MPEDFYQKVVKIAEVKYALDDDVILGFYDEIKVCWEAQFTPRRTVEVIAERMFG